MFIVVTLDVAYPKTVYYKGDHRCYSHSTANPHIVRDKRQDNGSIKRYYYCHGECSIDVSRHMGISLITNIRRPAFIADLVRLNSVFYRFVDAWNSIRSRRTNLGHDNRFPYRTITLLPKHEAIRSVGRPINFCTRRGQQTVRTTGRLSKSRSWSNIQANCKIHSLVWYRTSFEVTPDPRAPRHRRCQSHRPQRFLKVLIALKDPPHKTTVVVLDHQ